MRAQHGLPQGWMSKVERQWLALQGRAVDGFAIEVGSWRGRSTVAFLKHFSPRARLYCVDTWSGPPDGDEDAGQAAIYIGAGDVAAQFLANIARAGRSRSVIPLRMESARGAREIMRQHGPASADFVFIDADHRYEAARADILAYLPLVRSGGIISGHDYSRKFPGVIQAVNEIFMGAETILAAGSIWSSRV